jgi:hypothetical protein
MSYRKLLIVQFNVLEGDSLEFFHAVEDVLYQAFQQNRFAVVDGHDYGQGLFNIFIYPKYSWTPVIERVFAFLKFKGWLERAVIAKNMPSGKWQVVWPENYDRAFSTFRFLEDGSPAPFGYREP